MAYSRAQIAAANRYDWQGEIEPDQWAVERAVSALPDGFTALWWASDSETGPLEGAVASWSPVATSAETAALTQGTGDSQPVMTAGLTNGRPLVRFDGTDDFLATADWGSTLAQPLGITIWCQVLDLTSGDTFVAGNDATNDPRIRVAGGGGFAIQSTTPSLGSGGAGPGTAFAQFDALFYSGSSLSQLGYNGTVIAGPGDCGSASMDGCTVGANQGGLSPAQVDIGAVFITSAAYAVTNAAEVADLKAALDAFYGIT